MFQYEMEVCHSLANRVAGVLFPLLEQVIQIGDPLADRLAGVGVVHEHAVFFSLDDLGAGMDILVIPERRVDALKRLM